LLLAFGLFANAHFPKQIFLLIKTNDLLVAIGGQLDNFDASGLDEVDRVRRVPNGIDDLLGLELICPGESR
jgi:hypothetical protein